MRLDMLSIMAAPPDPTPRDSSPVSPSSRSGEGRANATGVAASRAATMPAQIGPYRLIRKLGAGGMGTVYLAEETVGRHTVALKVLPKTDQTPPTLLRRFLAESHTASRLRHPHVVAIYDSGEADGHLYLAMEYLDGPDLERQVRKGGPLSPTRSVKIVRQIAAALAHAHAAGIIHRDIKPANILLRKDGTALLTDMGLARAVSDEEAANITRAGYTVGTVDFMAPEQARNSKAADVRSDLYSLGCTWFHMLTGKAPFHEGDLTNKLRAHAQSPPPDPRGLRPEIPAGIVAVLQRLMSKKPEDRYQSAELLIRELDRPTLCRRSVTDDDLRGLADADALIEVDNEAENSSDDDDLVVGRDDGPGDASTESAETSQSEGLSPAPASAGGSFSFSGLASGEALPTDVTTETRSRPARGGDPRPVLRRGANSVRGVAKPADRVRAALVLVLLVGIVALAIWGLLSLDSRFGGNTHAPHEIEERPNEAVEPAASPTDGDAAESDPTTLRREPGPQETPNG